MSTIKNVFFIAIIAITLLSIVFSATANIPMPGGYTPTTTENGKSIAHYLRIINFNLISGELVTITPQITTASISPTTSIKLQSSSISTSCIDKILSENSSPALGLGKVITEQSKKYSIDPSVALAWFRKESSFGKLGKANENNSFGNRKDTTGNFIKYTSWDESILDWFAYMDRKYIQEGKITIEGIVPIYAPSNENDTQTYIAQIKQWTEEYRAFAQKTC